MSDLHFPTACATIYADYLSTLSDGGGEQKAASKVMRQYATLCPAAFDRLNEIAEECTFEVRRYSSQFYCWAQHPDIESFGDPWPASRFPKAVLCMVIAGQLATKTHF